MPSRAYDNGTRLRRQAELRQRIARAAAALHAEKGVLETSYADIAASAGVSVPTVYNHFPQRDELLEACTGHVGSAAPVIPAQDIFAAPDLRAAATLLVDALDRINAYYEPWIARREDRCIPFLARLVDARRRELTGFIAGLLEARGIQADRQTVAAAWEALLSFPAWHRLVREHRLSRTAVRALQADLLLAVCGPQPAARPPRPTSRK